MATRIEHRPLHFMGGQLDGPADVVLPGVGFGEAAQDVLHHDHAAIDDHAEIERPQREQIRGYVAQVQQNRGKEQRERNGQGHNQGGTDVSQKEEQDQDHQKMPSLRLRSTVCVV